MTKKLAKLIRETWYFWLLFGCLGFVTGRHDGDLPMSYRGEFLASLAFAFFVALWVVTDARHRERSLGYGFPALVFFVWPIFGPLYLFQTRGARACLTLLAFVAIFIVAVAIGAVIGIVTQS
jgi:hypothetical protein